MYQQSRCAWLDRKQMQKAKTLLGACVCLFRKIKYGSAANLIGTTYLQLGNDDNRALLTIKIVAEHPECSYTGKISFADRFDPVEEKRIHGAIATLDKVLAAYPRPRAFKHQRDARYLQTKAHGWHTNKKLKTIRMPLCLSLHFDQAITMLHLIITTKAICETE